MKLHESKNEFEDLIQIAAQHFGIPAPAVRRDYHIVRMLQNLAGSAYADNCVFKGGTSLSKCYPGSIERFSEDIDLTFIPDAAYSDKKYSKVLRQIEACITQGYAMEKIESERNARNKSSYVWPSGEEKSSCRIKLEIGSSVRPDPYAKKTLKTYIQEYLEAEGLIDAVHEFALEAVPVNTLDITRTFLDKVMAVKRHALCGTLPEKVRHIYDVVMLLRRPEIQAFLQDGKNLKTLLRLTKETDGFYLSKRNIAKDYDPLGKYAFSGWMACFDKDIRNRYESLHEDLLYTSEKQNFAEALAAFRTIDWIFSKIGE